MIPDISVIIPTRDALDYLPAAIASIGADPAVEIIVIDDGSRDGTDVWLAAMAARDARVRVLQGPGHGPATARNLGIAAARGALCAFLDADDVWAPGKLAAQRAVHAADPEIGFSFTDYRHVTVNGMDRGTCFAYWPRFARQHGRRDTAFRLDRPVAALFAETVVGTSTVMARTNLLRAVGGFSTALASAEDWDLWLALATRAPVAVLPGVLMDYLMHRPGNETGRMTHRVLAMQEIAARYRQAAMAEDRAAGRLFDARLAGARAEIATRAGARLRAAGLRLSALLAAPSRRAAYDFAGALRGAA